jgi:nucleotide-binding universal stress UspA family protein
MRSPAAPVHRSHPSWSASSRRRKDTRPYVTPATKPSSASSLLVVDLSKDGHDATPAAVDADLDGLRAELDTAEVAVDIAPPDPLFEPSEHLLKVAQEADSTLIVLGLRHRSRVGKFLLGSSAQRILLEADRPVLTAAHC